MTDEEQAPKLLQKGDEVVLRQGSYDTPRVVRIERVTATQAIVKGRKLRREIGSNGYLNEIGAERWSLRSWFFGSPELLAKTRTAGELADARDAALVRLNDAHTRVSKASKVALEKLTADLLLFLNTPANE